MTRLYIVEGMPCSGKSTMSRFLADELTARGRNVAYTDEGSGEHPADYEFSAYVTTDVLASFSEALQTKILACSEGSDGGYIVPLACFGGEELDLLIQHKIYDFLPWETERPLMLKKWRSFAEKADRDTVYVFNCVLLQNPMCETMMRFGFSAEQSLDYISEIAQIIRPLEPAVIYLSSDDIADRVRETAQERGDWLNGVIDYHVSGGYGRSIDAQGFEGYITCLEERRRRELTILERLPLRSMVIRNPHRDWDAARRAVTDFIDN